MRLIHITGTSGTGKTTLIREILPLLIPQGKVAVIKHLPHHDVQISPGKDTTFFFQEGAPIVAGIDQVKTLILQQDQSLFLLLSALCTEGVTHCIIEGFKSIPLPKVVLGDYPAGPCVLHNPIAREVVEALSHFDVFMTMPAMLSMVIAHNAGEGDCEGSQICAASSYPLKGLDVFSDKDYFATLGRLRTSAGEISAAVQHSRATACLLMHVQNGRVWDGCDSLFLVAAGRYMKEAAELVDMACAMFCRRCREEFPEIRHGMS